MDGHQTYAVELCLNPGLRGRYRLSEIRADTYLDGNFPNMWGVRASFAGVPDEEGRVRATLRFLSPDAPVGDLLGKQLVLRRGGQVVASCLVVDVG